MSIEDTTRFETLRAAAVALLRAWKGELVGFAQEKIPGLSFADREYLEIGVEEDGLSVLRAGTGRIERLGKAGNDASGKELGRILVPARDLSRDIVLRIDPALVLRPSLRLPWASRRTLKGALQHELERLTPIERSEVYFDFTVDGRDEAANAADITVRIVRRKVLDQAVLACHGAGLLIGAVAFAGDTREADWTSFPVDRAAWARSLCHRFGTLALAGLAGILVAAVLIAGLERGARANDALSDAVDDAQTRAAVVERMEHRIEAANKALALLVAKREEPLFIDSLARLSRLLPTGTWLTELHLESGKFRADGYSTNASALIAIIDKSGTFANVEFTAPLVRNQSDNTDRFELTFDSVPPKRRTP